MMFEFPFAGVSPHGESAVDDNTKVLVLFDKREAMTTQVSGIYFLSMAFFDNH